MPFIAAAAVGAAVGFASGFTVLGLTALQTALLSFVVQVALGFITQALAPKPKVPNLGSFTAEAQDRTQSFRQPVAPWRIIYGEVRASGPLTFVETTGNDKYLHMLITIASHPVQAIDTIYLNDDAIPPHYVNSEGLVTQGKYANKVRIFKDLGTATGQPFPALASSVSQWTADHRQTGRAKLYLRLEHSQDLFPTAVPNISAWVKGKKVTDPRVASAVSWSPNPALCIRDWLTTSTTKGGFGATTLEFGDTFTNAAANACEEIVSTQSIGVSVTTAEASTNTFILEGSTTRIFTGDRIRVSSTGGSVPGGLSSGSDYYALPTQRLGQTRIQVASTLSNALASTVINLTDGGTGTLKMIKTGEPRYFLNGVIETNKNGNSILTDMLSAMGGRAVYASGVWRLFAAVWTSPTTQIGEDDIIAPLKIQTRPSRRDRFNAVKGIYVTTLNYDQPSDYPPVTNTTYVTEDNGETLYQDLDLPMTSRPHMAQRLAQIELERHRQPLTVEVTVNLMGLQIQAGDVVQITNTRMGWANKSFEVIEWALSVTGEDQPVIGVTLKLRETASGVFDWNSSSETAVDPAPNSNLPGAFSVSPPTNLSVTETLYDTRGSSGVKSRATVMWSAPGDQLVNEFQLRYKLSAASEWTYLPNVRNDTTSIELNDTNPGTYDFAVRAMNFIGVRSAWTTKTGVEINGLLDPPTEPQNLTLSAAGGLAILRWTRSPDLDVRIGGFLRFRHSNLSTGATWPNSVSIGENIPGGETIGILPLKAGTYLARFVDSSGVESLLTTSVTTKQATVIDFTTVSTIQEDATFLGSAVNAGVQGSVLRLGGSALVDSIAEVDLVVDWDKEGGISRSGTYMFSSIFDFGSTQKRRVTTVVSAITYDAFSLLDSRTENIDDWSDFDAVTGANADFRVYLRQTDDDPTGSPTWGTWELVESSEVEAWGVQLRATLTSVDGFHNIDVGKLRASADRIT
jgi:hypothetical protein